MPVLQGTNTITLCRHEVAFRNTWNSPSLLAKCPCQRHFQPRRCAKLWRPLKIKQSLGLWYWAFFFKILKVTQWARLRLALSDWRLNLHSLFNRKPCANLLRSRSRGDLSQTYNFDTDVLFCQNFRLDAAARGLAQARATHVRFKRGVGASACNACTIQTACLMRVRRACVHLPPA